MMEVSICIGPQRFEVEIRQTYDAAILFFLICRAALSTAIGMVSCTFSSCCRRLG